MQGRAALTLALITLATSASATDWRPLTGAEIAAALGGKVLAYEGARQEFYASGRTLYNAGSDSWGYWRVEGDQYCSQWPPGDLWSCYDLEEAADGSRLRFVGGEGDVTEGAYAE